jgi:hypothetical protein
MAATSDLLTEFGEMTLDRALTRRKAINMLAKRHHMSPNEVYAAIEARKKSGD